MTVQVQGTSLLTVEHSMIVRFSGLVTGTHTVYLYSSWRVNCLHSRNSTSFSFHSCLATFTLRSSYCTGAGTTGAQGAAQGLAQPVSQPPQPPRERRNRPLAWLSAVRPTSATVARNAVTINCFMSLLLVRVMFPIRLKLFEFPKFCKDGQ